MWVGRRCAGSWIWWYPAHCCPPANASGISLRIAGYASVPEPNTKCMCGEREKVNPQNGTKSLLDFQPPNPRSPISRGFPNEICSNQPRFDYGAGAWILSGVDIERETAQRKRESSKKERERERRGRETRKTGLNYFWPSNPPRSPLSDDPLARRGELVTIVFWG